MLPVIHTVCIMIIGWLYRDESVTYVILVFIISLNDQMPMCLILFVVSLINHFSSSLNSLNAELK